MFVKFFYVLARIVLKCVYFCRVEGRENIPKGGCLICANHSCWHDPIFVGVAVGIEPKLNIMAKQELFDNKFRAWFFGKLGAFPVKRGEGDLSAIRKAYQVLANQERLLIFPEGTRYDKLHAKSGAGMFALRTGCTVLPVYVSEGRKLFHRKRVVIGKPFVPEKPAGKLSHEDYAACSDDILKRIYELAPKS
ncbi:MAG: lysophospholipid acyltransferase family protein [Clostridiales bacterium]|nr:lysophospholipid acyltransferase family protein [Clostridiales bacterium]